LLAIVDGLLLSETTYHILGLSIRVLSLALPDRTRTHDHHARFDFLIPVDSIVSLRSEFLLTLRLTLHHHVLVQAAIILLDYSNAA
jgi:hypothetical protein